MSLDALKLYIYDEFCFECVCLFLDDDFSETNFSMKS